MPKQVWLFLAPGFEEVEALTPWDVLKRAGAEVRAWSLHGGPVTGRSGITVLADADWSAGAGAQALPSPDLIVLPGGQPGSRHLSEDSALRRLAEAQLRANRPLGAICAAPAVALGAWGLLEGRRFTGFPGTETSVAAGRFEARAVVRDGSLLTSRGLGTALPFALALTAALFGPEKARDIAGQVVASEAALSEALNA